MRLESLPKIEEFLKEVLKIHVLKQNTQLSI